MSLTTKVSVIVPVYNQEKYIRACLESVLEQTLKDIEVICIDDCSQDHSADILAEYEKRDVRIQVIHNKQNGGLSFSRNQGLRSACGEYVCFLDSDDMLTPTALEELYGVAKKDNTDVIFFDAEMKIESDKVSKAEAQYCQNGEYKGVMTGKYFLREMQKINDIRIPACMQFWNRTCFERLSMCFFPGLLHEDILFTYMGLIKAERVECVRKAYYIYRRHNDSITLNKVNLKYFESLITIYQEILNYWYLHMEEGIDEITKNYLKMVQWKINKYAQEVNESEEKLKEFWGQNSFYYYWYKILVDSPIEVKNDSGLDVEKLVQLVKAEQLYVYGAGKVAARIMELLENNQIDIDGVAVTDTDANPSVFLEKPVYGVDEILKYKETCTVLVGVGKKLRDEVVHNLMDKGFNNIVEIY